MNENNISTFAETMEGLIAITDDLIENDLLPISFLEKVLKFSEKEVENEKNI